MTLRYINAPFLLSMHIIEMFPKNIILFKLVLYLFGEFVGLFELYLFHFIFVEYYIGELNNQFALLKPNKSRINL